VLIKPEKPRILALDLMSVLGYACRAEDGSIHCGTETFVSKHQQSSGMRWLRFRNWLRVTCKDVKPDIVYYEEVVGYPLKNKGRDSKVFHGFEATLTGFCEAAELEYQGISVGTIKKFIAGNGNAPKEAVVNAVKALGHHPANHNEADAIALLLLAETLVEA
jgi:Holliday junction resolvasome RuvABC endonuclease subunit